jgi:hypothetical protein
MAALTRLALLFALAALVATGCGGNGDDEAAPPQDTETVETEPAPPPPAEGEDDAELERQADRIETTIEDRVRGLADARSTDDLAREVGEARRELEAAADDVGDLDVSAAREQARADLEESTRRVARELEDVEREAGAGNLVAAVREAANLDSLRDLEDALRRAREG